VSELERRLQNVEALIEALEELPDGGVRKTAVGAVKELLDLHGEVLERMLTVLDEGGEPGRRFIDALGQDPMVGGLLILHGIHPLSLEDRVLEALDRVRPYLGSHGGDVELVGTAGGAVKLRLRGSCHGCASSRVTLEQAIERGIMEVAPDVTAIEVEGVEQPRPPAGFVPLAQVGRARAGPRS
jgi:Fe-S cluster biogenesis protein NfuA